MKDKEFLEKIKAGEITIEDGLKFMQEESYKEMAFAKLDFQRKRRRGFGEVIFCEGKENFALLEIFKAFRNRKENVLGTRASVEQFNIIYKEIPEIQYDTVARTLILEYDKIEKLGNIAICTGGTADLKVAEEARKTCEFLGANVSTFYDVGVSGLHRLLSKIEEIRKANIIIAVAGMEGALATVLAGLVNKPIIAVPTSVGYGANFGGIVALLTMLNSCAEGVSVVNIDNGFGAGYQASQINKLIEEGK